MFGKADPREASIAIFDERGFTLVEVLVAFVIAVMALAVLTRIGVDGMTGAALSGKYQEALARARSHLDGLGEMPQPGENEGDEGDGFHWHVRVVRVAAGSSTRLAARSAGSAGAAQSPPPRTQAPQRVSLLAVRVTISWGMPPRSVTLDSERVAPDGAAL